MATIAANSISYTSEGAVTISYKTLVSSPLSLTASIEKAFGSSPDSLGIIVVHDLPPSFVAYRERLLKLAYNFAHLDESTREKYADAKSSFGWSHGKGSYYANPVIDIPSVSPDVKLANPEYYEANIWPEHNEKSVEGFEQAFKDLGRLIFKVGCELADACQPFASPYMTDKSKSLSGLITSSQTVKARLLHYFPPSPDAPLPAEDEPVDSWCGFHLDHSLLTGLCSAMYLHKHTTGPPTAVRSPSPSSGLYIKTRGGDLTKVTIPTDCLAFQTGEALELATNGRLRATPHCVRVGAAEDADKISRETFALFMQPDVNEQISEKETFGQFSQRIFDEHYKGEGETA
ncbi:hypothetical protein EUX98_g4466 [Antrodiella citrinella]|uniref:Uncharacterized protein n=1 Tax=Antrodiella citrinella TaxID=2447956 RepID=A0A4V3XIL9_9APHY|nr:hypothetical protein EUX98_g4466 [Antrodiella citrinella]